MSCLTKTYGMFTLLSGNLHVPLKEENGRQFTGSIYILVKNMLFGPGCTYNMVAGLFKTYHKVLNYQYMCNQWNSLLKHLCGAIESGSKDSLIWIIEVIPTNLIEVYFHHFLLLSSYQCEINSVVVIRYGGQWSSKQLYCGDLPSWKEICECSKIKVQLSIRWMHYTTSQFSLKYYIGKQQIFSNHHSLMHLPALANPEFIKVIKVTKGTIIHVVSPKTSLIHMLLMLHERQTDRICVQLSVYDGPSALCPLLPSKISSTHQILITLENNTCEEAVQIHLPKISTPQLYHMGTYIYNSSNVLAFLHVTQFINPHGGKGDRILVKFDQVMFDGHKCRDCEYGGLLLSSPEHPFFPPHEHVSTEILYCDQFLPYFESPLSILNATSVIYAYTVFAQVSLSISVLESSNSSSVRIGSMRSWLKMSDPYTNIRKVLHGILIFDNLPQLKNKTIQLQAYTHKTPSATLLSGPDVLIHKECFVNMLMNRTAYHHVLKISFKYWWMLPPMKIDICFTDHLQLLSNEKSTEMATLNGVSSIHVQFLHSSHITHVLLTVNYISNSKFTKLTITNMNCSGIMTLFSLWHFKLSSNFTWPLHNRELQVQWFVTATNCVIEYKLNKGDFLPADRHSRYHVLVYGWWVQGGGQHDSSLYRTRHMSFSWMEAQSFCLRRGRNLATINSYERLNIMLHKLRNLIYYMNEIYIDGLGEIFFIGGFMSQVGMNFFISVCV